MTKHLLLIIAALCCVTSLSAQTLILRSDSTLTQLDRRLAADLNLFVPYGSAPSLNSGLNRIGAVYYNTSDSLLYVYAGGGAWRPALVQSWLNGRYLRLGGLVGGQTVTGGTASGNNLTLSSTANATKGKILFGTGAYDEANYRLGIGTNNPQTQVHISDGNLPSASFGAVFNSRLLISANAGYEMYILSASNNDFDRGVYGTARARGTVVAPAAVQTNDILGSLLGGGYDGSQLNFGGGVFMYADGTPTAGNTPTRLSLVTGNNSATRQERLVVKSDGKIGIGNTAPTYLFDVSGTGTTPAGRFQINHGSSDALYVQSTASLGYSSVGFLSTAGGQVGSFGYANTGANPVLADKVFFNANAKDMVFSVNSGSGVQLFIQKSSGRVGIGTTSPTAMLHLPAGTAAAATAPFKYTSGTLLTTPEAGAKEFVTDKEYLTITTGSARKEITLNDAALNSGIVPVTTTNGRLSNSTVTAAELGYLSGLTSPVQTQLTAKATDANVLHKTGDETKAGKLNLTGGYHFENNAESNDEINVISGIATFATDEGGQPDIDYNIPKLGFRYNDGIRDWYTGISAAAGGLKVFSQNPANPGDFNFGLFDATSLLASYRYHLPNASGTLALRSSPFTNSYTGPRTLGALDLLYKQKADSLYATKTGKLNLSSGYHFENYAEYNDGASTNPGTAFLETDKGVFPDDVGMPRLGFLWNNGVNNVYSGVMPSGLGAKIFAKVGSSATVGGTLNATNLTYDQVYDLPNASGALALRSSPFTNSYTGPRTLGALDLLYKQKADSLYAPKGSIASYTFGTGLTNTGGTVVNNLSSGVAGGQSVIGGTAAGNNLTLSSTANATKGKIVFGNSVYDEVNNRLGIGIAAPNRQLEVVGNLAATLYNFGAYIRNTNAGGYSELAFDNDATTGGGSLVLGYGGSTSGNPNEAYLFQRKNANLLFGTNNTTRMVIDGSGKVGIGTNSPQASVHISDGNALGSAFTSSIAGSSRLMISSNGNPASLGMPVASNTANIRANTIMVKSRGTLASPTAVALDDNIGDLLFGAYDGGTIQNAAGVFAFADAAPVANTSAPIRLSFVTGTTGANRQERLVVKSDGKIGIGNTAPTYLFDVSGTGTTPAGRFQINHASSDALYVQSTAALGYSSVGFLSTAGGQVGSFGYANTGANPVLADKVFFNSNTKDMVFSVNNGGAAQLLIQNTSGRVGIGTTSPTAALHLKAGTAAASTAPFKYTSGTLLTTPEAGAKEFVTDKEYLTITTGAARKEITLNDAALNSGIVPVTTTNGRLTNSTVSTTELGYVSGVTSAIQAQLNSKQLALGYTAANESNVVHKTGDESISGLKSFNNNIGIGTASLAGYKLAVAGGVLAESIKVLPHGQWPDYVFGKRYKLPSLAEVEKYIDANQHLPEMPAAAEVKKEGIELGDMNAKLLKKIEELTLYLIEMKKENDELKSRVGKLEQVQKR